MRSHKQHRISALDYGCGAGNLTKLLHENFENVTASDLSEEMLKITAQRFSSVSNVKVLPLNELKGSTFDLIICSSVIEYSENDLEMLKSLNTYLNPSGILIITFPNKFGFLQMVNRYVLSLINSNNYTRFQNHTYTSSSIKSLANKC